MYGVIMTSMCNLHVGGQVNLGNLSQLHLYSWSGVIGSNILGDCPLTFLYRYDPFTALEDGQYSLGHLRLLHR